MPYLDAERKAHMDAGGKMVTAGDLTYVLTRICLDAADNNIVWDLAETACIDEAKRYLEESGVDNFQKRCEAIGALQCARLEYRRRRPNAYLHADAALYNAQVTFYAEDVAPYEDGKIETNGDVF